MEHLTPVEIDPKRAFDAFEHLRLHSRDGNADFRDRLRAYAADRGLTETNALLRGLSDSNVKGMRRGKAKVPRTLPRLLVSFLFCATNIDVTSQQCLSAFHQLGFDIQLALDVQTRNVEDSAHDVHDLKNLRFEIHEANTTAEDPEAGDFELDLRIGFDRTRLTLRAEGLRALGNYLAAETPAAPGEGAEPDYTGWFRMRLATRDPLSWVFDPINEGEILAGRVGAEDLARVETARGAALLAEISARRDALKVRIVDENGGRRASKSLSDEHRDKMCAAVARKSFAGAADEFLIHRVPLVRGEARGVAELDGETQCL